MGGRQRVWMAGILTGLCAFAALGVGWVLAKQEPGRVEAFATRFTGFDTLALTAAAEITLAVTPDTLQAKWPAQAVGAVGEGGLAIQSRRIPLGARSSAVLQADVSVGGAQNTWGARREGYRVWLALTLYRGGVPCGESRVEILLASDKERARLYSLRVPYGQTAPDAYGLSLTVTPENGALAAGALTCAWLEVIP